MIEEICSISSEGKMAKNEWESDGSDFFKSVYEKIRVMLFPYLLVYLFKQRCISSVKSYKYLNKLIS